MNKEDIIRHLGLIPHPEGGYFKEVCHSSIGFHGQFLYSSILFLLGEGDISHLHVLQEDELWYYQSGEDCIIYEIDPEGRLTITHLGPSTMTFQHLVRKGNIFGSRIFGKTYSLVGCLVSPSFTYEHFHMVKEDELPRMTKENLDKIHDMII